MSAIVNDVTWLNPVEVFAIATPTTVEEVQEAVRGTTNGISVGGGHFSMGGTTASKGSLHLDMRKLNRILVFSPERKTIRVQAGVRWCDIQKFVDPHGLAVKIMQTYANFTVGGSISVNVHGRYIGLGPLVMSLRWVKLVLANGELLEASRTDNPEVFYGVAGGYGALGVIVEAELDLAENTRIERRHVKLATGDYWRYFKENVRGTPGVVFHNADLYAPHYSTARAVSWIETKRPVTTRHDLQPRRRNYPLENYFLWAVSETPFGRWRREFLIDPVLYLLPKVHWRNYEAGYDVAELEPPSRKHRTYVLQEYFVPVERFDEFVPRMAEVLNRHRVNALNVSVRHAFPDRSSLLSWAPKETFAFVLYYKQRTRDNARERVAVWTRELIEAALSVEGTYYLPYQPHATSEQFHRGYPRAKELFAVKKKLDPDYKLRNTLWDTYYAPRPEAKVTGASEFHMIYGDTQWRDAFYRFLQNVYRIFPEDRFHTLIRQACNAHGDDEAIYRHIQQRLSTIKPFLSELFYAVPSLIKQKAEMARQTLELLGERRRYDGYVEIGSTGRYAGVLRKHLEISGTLAMVNDLPPTYSPVDVVERGRLRKLGAHVPLADFQPIGADCVPDGSVDFVSCYIGLHHITPAGLEPFVRSIARMLRPGGIFILRDHDVTSPQMNAFVSLAHAVFNAGLGVPWENNAKELRHFAPVDEWVKRLDKVGLRDSGKRLLQAHDPTDNVLMSFIKQ